ncbi:MAG: VOC family protein [Streptosporangiaceae bacterium]
MSKTTPALPVHEVRAAAAYYRDLFGFEAVYVADDFARLVRDDAELHLWGAMDDDWPAREDLRARPVCSGAESFLAGTGSCRIEVADVDALFGEFQPQGLLHDASRGVHATGFGTREFSAVDLDGNLLTFYRRVESTEDDRFPPSS